MRHLFILALAFPWVLACSPSGPSTLKGVYQERCNQDPTLDLCQPIEVFLPPNEEIISRKSADLGIIRIMTLATTRPMITAMAPDGQVISDRVTVRIKQPSRSVEILRTYEQVGLTNTTVHDTTLNTFYPATLIFFTLHPTEVQQLEPSEPAFVEAELVDWQDVSHTFSFPLTITTM